MAKVNFFLNQEDMTVAILGTLGLSTDYIKSMTNFSDGQILYRLRSANVKRSNYRNGDSPIINGVLKHSRTAAINLVKHSVKHAKTIKTSKTKART